MKLSTTATYGLRICFLLSLSEKVIPLSALVAQTDLSEKYLEQILGKLRKNNIVGAKRGASGGYYLLKKPKDITVNDVLKALNCDFGFAQCVTGGCNDSYCPNKNLFKRIRYEIKKVC